MKIAIVHDDLLQWGGAERVVRAFMDTWPEADLFTSVADPLVINEHFANIPIRQSSMHYLPTVRKFRRAHFPLYPFALRQFDFSDYDVVLSSSTRFAHTVATPQGLHIAYFHAPPRFVWSADRYLQYESHAALKQFITKPITRGFATFDKKVIGNVNYLIANSKNIAKQISVVYQRKATVISPFVDTQRFTPAGRRKTGDYYLIVSRLVAWKRIDIAILACKMLNVPLLVIGKGPDESRLKSLARGSKTTFLHDLTDADMVTYYRNGKALIVTQEEDFGLSALEAQACGIPVIAYGKGGVLETVQPGKTALLYTTQSPAAVKRALQRFAGFSYSEAACQQQANRFSKSAFQNHMKQFVQEHFRQSR